MIDNLFKKKGWVRTTIFTLGIVFIVLIIFQAGRFTGYRQAAMTYGMGAKYYRVFDERGGPGPRDFFTEAHGAVGEIISVNLPTFVVKGPDNVEKVVLINDATEIRKFRSAASSTDLTTNEFVVVIGEPNTEAQVEARLIRIMPPPPER